MDTPWRNDGLEGTFAQLSLSSAKADIMHIHRQFSRDEAVSVPARIDRLRIPDL